MNGNCMWRTSSFISWSYCPRNHQSTPLFDGPVCDFTNNPSLWRSPCRMLFIFIYVCAHIYGKTISSFITVIFPLPLLPFRFWKPFLNQFKKLFSLWVLLMAWAKRIKKLIFFVFDPVTSVNSTYHPFSLVYLFLNKSFSHHLFS